MRIRTSVIVLFVFALAVGRASEARAQDSSWRDLKVSAGRMDFDLSGTGNAPAFSVAATRDLSSNVSLELRGTYARPDQQFGPSSLYLPEAQLQYRWDIGRVSPYVGGGIGAALVRSSFRTDWDPTLSGAAGTAVRLNDRLGLSGELRVRGHEWRFVGTTADVTVGLTWQLGAF